MTGPEQTLPMTIGATENALRALLERTLSGTGIEGYDQWVELNEAAKHDEIVRSAISDARSRVAKRTSALTAELDPSDVAIAMRVLGRVRERAERMLGD